MFLPVNSPIRRSYMCQIMCIYCEPYVRIARASLSYHVQALYRRVIPAKSGVVCFTNIMRQGWLPRVKMSHRIIQKRSQIGIKNVQYGLNLQRSLVDTLIIEMIYIILINI